MEYVNVIYRIVNLLEEKSYIGKAKNLDKRIKQHRIESRKKKTPLYSAIRKHGWDNFKIEVVGFASCYEELDSLEIAAIEEFKTLYPGGYNLTKGGTGGDVVTAHPNKEHLYTTRKGREPWNKGTKGVCKAWNKGTKGIMKPNSTTFQSGENHTLYGKKQSKSTVTKRVANTDYLERTKNFPWKQKAQKCMKPVLQICIESSQVTEWESATTAAKELNIPRHVIFNHLDKPTSVNGFLWKRKK